LARTKEQKNWRHMQVCSAYKLVEYFNLDGVGIPCYVLFLLYGGITFQLFMRPGAVGEC
jgi:hypothetical protein